jgi:DegV family protein with EDD domain
MKQESQEMLRIVTDGATDMPSEWVGLYEINVVPLYLNFGQKSYTQGVDIGPQNFYKLVQERHKIPQTSLPSPQKVVDFYRSIANKGDQVLSIHLASKLSGTFSVFQSAARELVGELNIYAFDSLAGSAATGFMCQEARLLERAGIAFPDILARLEQVRKQLMVIFTVDNLEFARLSGRVNSLQAVFSSVLKIKPIIVLRDGLLFAADKVRTRQKALDHMLEMVLEGVGNKKVRMAVVHAADPETARWLIEKARTLFNIKEIIMTDLSLPVAAHLGPGTVGIVAYPIED